MSTPPSKWTRRDWIRASLIAGAAAGAGAVVGATAYSQLFPPTSRSEGELRQSFVYLSFPEDVWWNRFAGQDVRVTDFQDWQGALAVWNGRFKDGNWVSGTGYPALVIRLKRDDRYFQAPTDVLLPAGYSLAFDDPSRDLRIVAIFNRSTHLCCYPDWHVPHAIAPARAYIAPSGISRKTRKRRRNYSSHRRPSPWWPLPAKAPICDGPHSDAADTVEV